MRSAQVDDTWRNLLKKSHSTKIENITVNGLNRFSNQQITFNGAITALCGLNGLGKSTLLNSLRVLIDSTEDDELREDIYKKINFSELKAVIKNQGEQIEVTMDQEMQKSIEFDIKLSWLDTSYQVPSLIKRFSEMRDIEGLLDGFEAYNLELEEKKLINYILAKNYSVCEIYEVELDGRTFPYFKVENSGFSYGTENMGHGEVAALYIYWKLRNAIEDTIFLIEEPETYLSSPAQKKIMDVIANFSLRKNLTFIITTHSSAILTEIPIRDIKLFTMNSSEGSIKLIDTEARRDYMFTLGLVPQKKGILLVEDRVSRIMLKHMLSIGGRNLNLEYEVVDCGSESEIKTNLKTFPQKIDWLKVFGIFDGDQKSKAEQIAKSIDESTFAFLPGKIPFESQCKYIVDNYPDKVIEYLRLDASKFYQTLILIQGEEVHDWFIDLGEYLGLSLDSLIKNLFDVGLENDIQFSEEVEESIKDILRILK